MSFNIVDLVKDQISDQIVGSMGSALGVQGAQASSAIGGALPGLLSGLTNTAGNAQGAGALFDAVKQQDDGLLGNIGNLLGGNEASSIANKGTSVLSSLLGTSALGSLAGAVANAAGIGRSSSSSILGMLAPIVMGVLKKKIFDGGLDAGGMANMLSSQKDNINAAMPQGFSDQLQSGGFFDSIANQASNFSQNATSSVSSAASNAVNSTQQAAGQVGDSVSSAASNAINSTQQAAGQVTDQVSGAASSGAGWLKKIIPVAVLAVLGWLAFQFFGGDKPEGIADSAQSTVSEAAGSVGALGDEAMQSARDAMPEGVDFDQINDGLTGVFGSATDALTGITDAESATAALPALEEAAGNLGGLSDMVGGLPDAAKGPISSIVGSGIEALQPLLEKVTAIPGVGDLIGPVVEPMMEMLQGMAG